MGLMSIAWGCSDEDTTGGTGQVPDVAFPTGEVQPPGDGGPSGDAADGSGNAEDGATGSEDGAAGSEDGASGGEDGGTSGEDGSGDIDGIDGGCRI